MSNKKVDGTLCFFRHTQGNNTGELVSVAVDVEAILQANGYETDHDYKRLIAIDPRYREEL